MGIASDFADIDEVLDTLLNNKVSKFCYTDTAYANNDADGVTAYDVNNEQNIPVGTPSVMKVNETVVTKGWRARASSVTRMFMNHMLGRLSYNVNKLTDLMSSVMSAIINNVGVANGFASLDSDGYVPSAQLVGSDAMLNSATYKEWLTKVFKDKFGVYWSEVTGDIASNSIWGVTFRNRLFLCRTDNGCWWSEDGRNWVKGTGITGGTYNISYANNLWYCNDSSHLYWSEDGKSWTACTGISTATSVVYNNGIYHANSGMYWSEDGKSWSAGTGFTDTGRTHSLTYGNGVWVCIAGTSLDISLRSYFRGHYYSTNGKQWTRFTDYQTSVLDERPSGVAYSEGKWAVYVGALLYYSSNGTTWTATGLDTSHTKSKLLAVNGLFVISSNGTTYRATSSDISYWRTAEYISSPTAVIEDLLFHSGGIIRVDSGGSYSPGINGINVLVSNSYSYANGVWLSNGLYSFDRVNWSYNDGNNIGRTFYCSGCYGKGVWVDVRNSKLMVSGIDELLASDYFDE